MHKFLALPTHERALLLRAVFLVAAVRIGLWLLPFGWLKKALAQVQSARGDRPRRGHISMDRIAWAVRVGSRYVPGATCLTQALSALILLTEHGYPARLRIGVAKKEGGDLEAHAWLESDGRAVIGDAADLYRYTPLPVFDWALIGARKRGPRRALPVSGEGSGTRPSECSGSTRSRMDDGLDDLKAVDRFC